MNSVPAVIYRASTTKLLSGQKGWIEDLIISTKKTPVQKNIFSRWVVKGILKIIMRPNRSIFICHIFALKPTYEHFFLVSKVLRKGTYIQWSPPQPIRITCVQSLRLFSRNFVTSLYLLLSWTYSFPHNLWVSRAISTINISLYMPFFRVLHENTLTDSLLNFLKSTE